MALHHNVDMSARMRATQALEMRCKGHTWEEIRKACGYKHPGEAFNAAKKVLERHEELAAEEYRKLESLRLDAMQAAIWNQALGFVEIGKDGSTVLSADPDLESMRTILKIMERRAKLLGLDIKPDQEMIQAQVLIREIAAPLGDV